jgi:hypothetical protein
MRLALSSSSNNAPQKRQHPVRCASNHSVRELSSSSLQEIARRNHKASQLNEKPTSNVFVSAMAILRQTSRDLAELIAAIASTLGLASTFALGLTGGVLIGREDVRAALIDELRGNCLEPTPTIVVDPAFGAVRITEQALLGGHRP